ncbi:MAG: MraY family glycosyltransferase [Candidatus Eisenbacteria bacterium]|nr:MraY family glycosyltransferase [Candidatus Eisenbacteria bacterium]
MFYLVALPLGLVLSLLLTPLAIAVAVRCSFFDMPDGKRYHRSAVPLLGGVAFTASVTAAWLLTRLVVGPLIETAEVILIIGLLSSFSLGMYDDKNGMKARWKLLGQFVCGSLLVTACYAGGWTDAGLLFPFLVVWVVAIMNAMNFLDNMDGIASGVTGLASLAFVLLLALNKQWVGVIIAGATCGASLGFLKFNFAPAKIFLGDAGSLPMGYLLSALSIMAAGSADLQAMVAPLIVLGYPVFDMSFVTVVRIKEHRKFYQGGKDHSSHRLASLLLSPRKTSLVIYALCLTLGGIALLVDGFGSPALSFSVLAAVFACFILLGLRLEKVASNTPPLESATR